MGSISCGLKNNESMMKEWKEWRGASTKITHVAVAVLTIGDDVSDSSSVRMLCDNMGLLVAIDEGVTDITKAA